MAAQQGSKMSELNRRILFTVFMLAVYRIGVFIPTPGVDSAALKAFFDNSRDTILGMASMFTGGALENFSIFALGIMPYITASIIMQLLTVVNPTLERLKKEGQQGQKVITEYTRYLTICIALVQAFMLSVGLEQMGADGQSAQAVLNPGWDFRIVAILTLTAGTAFLMWLGETITERGIGNGISLIITAGIVARMPAAIYNTIQKVQSGEMDVIALLLILLMVVGVIAFIVFVEMGQRRIPVQYPKRMVGRKQTQGGTHHLPLKVNSAGVIPPIFASSIIIFPATVVNFVDIPFLQSMSDTLSPGGLLYNIIFVTMIVFFAYFYTAIQFNPKEVAENLKKFGGFVPGIRPGQHTADYIDKILTRLTLWGSIYLSLICVLPTILYYKLALPFYFGGTALLIIVGVAMDTAQQIESHRMSRNYDGLMKKGKLKGRK